MRGKPAIDHCHMDEDTSDFLQRLRQLAGVEDDDEDSEDDPDYHPTHDERVPLRSITPQLDLTPPNATPPPRRTRATHRLDPQTLIDLDELVSSSDESIDLDTWTFYRPSLFEGPRNGST